MMQSRRRTRGGAARRQANDASKAHDSAAKKSDSSAVRFGFGITSTMKRTGQAEAAVDTFKGVRPSALLSGAQRPQSPNSLSDISTKELMKLLVASATDKGRCRILDFVKRRVTGHVAADITEPIAYVEELVQQHYVGVLMSYLDFSPQNQYGESTREAAAALALALSAYDNSHAALRDCTLLSKATAALREATPTCAMYCTDAVRNLAHTSPGGDDIHRLVELKVVQFGCQALQVLAERRGRLQTSSDSGRGGGGESKGDEAGGVKASSGRQGQDLDVRGMDNVAGSILQLICLCGSQRSGLLALSKLTEPLLTEVCRAFIVSDVSGTRYWCCRLLHMLTEAPAFRTKLQASERQGQGQGVVEWPLQCVQAWLSFTLGVHEGRAVDEADTVSHSDRASQSRRDDTGHWCVELELLGRAVWSLQASFVSISHACLHHGSSSVFNLTASLLHHVSRRLTVVTSPLEQCRTIQAMDAAIGMLHSATVGLLGEAGNGERMTGGGEGGLGAAVAMAVTEVDASRSIQRLAYMAVEISVEGALDTGAVWAARRSRLLMSSLLCLWMTSLADEGAGDVVLQLLNTGAFEVVVNALEQPVMAQAMAGMELHAALGPGDVQLLQVGAAPIRRGSLRVEMESVQSSHKGKTAAGPAGAAMRRGKAHRQRPSALASSSQGTVRSTVSSAPGSAHGHTRRPVDQSTNGTTAGSSSTTPVAPREPSVCERYLIRDLLDACYDAVRGCHDASASDRAGVFAQIARQRPLSFLLQRLSNDKVIATAVELVLHEEAAARLHTRDRRPLSGAGGSVDVTALLERSMAKIVWCVLTIAGDFASVPDLPLDLLNALLSAQLEALVRQAVDDEERRRREQAIADAKAKIEAEAKAQRKTKARTAPPAAKTPKAAAKVPVQSRLHPDLQPEPWIWDTPSAVFWADADRTTVRPAARMLLEVALAAVNVYFFQQLQVRAARGGMDVTAAAERGDLDGLNDVEKTEDTGVARSLHGFVGRLNRATISAAPSQVAGGSGGGDGAGGLSEWSVRGQGVAATVTWATASLWIRTLLVDQLLGLVTMSSVQHTDSSMEGSMDLYSVASAAGLDDEENRGPAVQPASDPNDCMVRAPAGAVGRAFVPDPIIPKQSPSDRPEAVSWTAGMDRPPLVGVQRRPSRRSPGRQRQGLQCLLLGHLRLAAGPEQLPLSAVHVSAGWCQLWAGAACVTNQRGLVDEHWDALPEDTVRVFCMGIALLTSILEPAPASEPDTVNEAADEAKAADEVKQHERGGQERGDHGRVDSGTAATAEIPHEAASAQPSTENDTGSDAPRQGGEDVDTKAGLDRVGSITEAVEPIDSAVESEAIATGPTPPPAIADSLKELSRTVQMTSSALGCVAANMECLNEQGTVKGRTRLDRTGLRALARDVMCAVTRCAILARLVFGLARGCGVIAQPAELEAQMQDTGEAAGRMDVTPSETVVVTHAAMLQGAIEVLRAVDAMRSLIFSRLLFSDARYASDAVRLAPAGLFDPLGSVLASLNRRVGVILTDTSEMLWWSAAMLLPDVSLATPTAHPWDLQSPSAGLPQHSCVRALRQCLDEAAGTVGWLQEYEADRTWLWSSDVTAARSRLMDAGCVFMASAFSMWSRVAPTIRSESDASLAAVPSPAMRCLVAYLHTFEQSFNLQRPSLNDPTTPRKHASLPPLQPSPRQPATPAPQGFVSPPAAQRRSLLLQWVLQCLGDVPLRATGHLDLGMARWCDDGAMTSWVQVWMTQAARREEIGAGVMGYRAGAEACFCTHSSTHGLYGYGVVWKAVLHCCTLHPSFRSRVIALPWSWELARMTCVAIDRILQHGGDDRTIEGRRRESTLLLHVWASMWAVLRHSLQSLSDAATWRAVLAVSGTNSQSSQVNLPLYQLGGAIKQHRRLCAYVNQMLSTDQSTRAALTPLHENAQSSITLVLDTLVTAHDRHIAGPASESTTSGPAPRVEDSFGYVDRGLQLEQELHATLARVHSVFDSRLEAARHIQISELSSGQGQLADVDAWLAQDLIVTSADQFVHSRIQRSQLAYAVNAHRQYRNGKRIIGGDGQDSNMTAAPLVLTLRRLVALATFSSETLRTPSAMPSVSTDAWSAAAADTQFLLHTLSLHPAAEWEMQTLLADELWEAVAFWTHAPPPPSSVSASGRALIGGLAVCALVRVLQGMEAEGIGMMVGQHVPKTVYTHVVDSHTRPVAMHLAEAAYLMVFDRVWAQLSILCCTGSPSAATGAPSHPDFQSMLTLAGMLQFLRIAYRILSHSVHSADEICQTVRAADLRPAFGVLLRRAAVWLGQGSDPAVMLSAVEVAGLYDDLTALLSAPQRVRSVLQDACPPRGGQQAAERDVPSPPSPLTRSSFTDDRGMLVQRVATELEGQLGLLQGQGGFGTEAVGDEEEALHLAAFDLLRQLAVGRAAEIHAVRAHVLAGEMAPASLPCVQAVVVQGLRDIRYHMRVLQGLCALLNHVFVAQQQSRWSAVLSILPVALRPQAAATFQALVHPTASDQATVQDSNTYLTELLGAWRDGSLMRLFVEAVHAVIRILEDGICALTWLELWGTDIDVGSGPADDMWLPTAVLDADFMNDLVQCLLLALVSAEEGLTPVLMTRLVALLDAHAQATSFMQALVHRSAAQAESISSDDSEAEDVPTEAPGQSSIDGDDRVSLSEWLERDDAERRKRDITRHLHAETASTQSSDSSSSDEDDDGDEGSEVALDGVPRSLYGWHVAGVGNVLFAYGTSAAGQIARRHVLGPSFAAGLRPRGGGRALPALDEIARRHALRNADEKSVAPASADLSNIAMAADSDGDGLELSVAVLRVLHEWWLQLFRAMDPRALQLDRGVAFAASVSGSVGPPADTHSRADDASTVKADVPGSSNPLIDNMISGELPAALDQLPAAWGVVSLLTSTAEHLWIHVVTCYGVWMQQSNTAQQTGPWLTAVSELAADLAMVSFTSAPPLQPTADLYSCIFDLLDLSPGSSQPSGSGTAALGRTTGCIMRRIIASWAVLLDRHEVIDSKVMVDADAWPHRLSPLRAVVYRTIVQRALRWLGRRGGCGRTDIEHVLHTLTLLTYCMMLQRSALHNEDVAFDLEFADLHTTLLAGLLHLDKRLRSCGPAQDPNPDLVGLLTGCHDAISVMLVLGMRAGPAVLAQVLVHPSPMYAPIFSEYRATITSALLTSVCMVAVDVSVLGLASTADQPGPIPPQNPSATPDEQALPASHKTWRLPPVVPAEGAAEMIVRLATLRAVLGHVTTVVLGEGAQDLVPDVLRADPTRGTAAPVSAIASQSAAEAAMRCREQLSSCALSDAHAPPSLSGSGDQGGGGVTYPAMQRCLRRALQGGFNSGRWLTTVDALLPMVVDSLVLNDPPTHARDAGTSNKPGFGASDTTLLCAAWLWRLRTHWPAAVPRSVAVAQSGCLHQIQSVASIQLIATTALSRVSSYTLHWLTTWCMTACLVELLPDRPGVRDEDSGLQQPVVFSWLLRSGADILSELEAAAAAPPHRDPVLLWGQISLSYLARALYDVEAENRPDILPPSNEVLAFSGGRPASRGGPVPQGAVAGPAPPGVKAALGTVARFFDDVAKDVQRIAVCMRGICGSSVAETKATSGAGAEAEAEATPYAALVQHKQLVPWLVQRLRQLRWCAVHYEGLREQITVSENHVLDTHFVLTGADLGPAWDILLRAVQTPCSDIDAATVNTWPSVYTMTASVFEALLDNCHVASGLADRVWRTSMQSVLCAVLTHATSTIAGAARRAQGSVLQLMLSLGNIQGVLQGLQTTFWVVLQLAVLSDSNMSALGSAGGVLHEDLKAFHAAVLDLWRGIMPIVQALFPKEGSVVALADSNTTDTVDMGKGDTRGDADASASTDTAEDTGGTAGAGVDISDVSARQREAFLALLDDLGFVCQPLLLLLVRVGLQSWLPADSAQPAPAPSATTNPVTQVIQSLVVACNETERMYSACYRLVRPRETRRVSAAGVLGGFLMRSGWSGACWGGVEPSRPRTSSSVGARQRSLQPAPDAAAVARSLTVLSPSQWKPLLDAALLACVEVVRHDTQPMSPALQYADRRDAQQAAVLRSRYDREDWLDRTLLNTSRCFVISHLASSPEQTGVGKPRPHCGSTLAAGPPAAPDGPLSSDQLGTLLRSMSEGMRSPKQLASLWLPRPVPACVGPTLETASWSFGLSTAMAVLDDPEDGSARTGSHVDVFTHFEWPDALAMPAEEWGGMLADAVGLVALTATGAKPAKGRW